MLFIPEPAYFSHPKHAYGLDSHDFSGEILSNLMALKQVKDFPHVFIPMSVVKNFSQHFHAAWAQIGILSPFKNGGMR